MNARTERNKARQDVKSRDIPQEELEDHSKFLRDPESPSLALESTLALRDERIAALEAERDMAIRHAEIVTGQHNKSKCVWATRMLQIEAALNNNRERLTGNEDEQICPSIEKAFVLHGRIAALTEQLRLKGDTDER